jgi:hypothetical protein
MTEFLLLTLGGTCLAIMALCLLRRDGVYQYPFLATGVFAGFVLVQLVGLSNNSFLPPGALNKTIFMTLLCLMMVYAGDKFGTLPYRAFEWQYSRNRLLVASAALSLIGAFFFFQISRLPVELKSSQWSGIVVAYHFFAQTMTYGLAIAVLVYIGTSSKIALGIVICDLTFYVDRIFVGARRGDAAELLVIIALALWFKRGLIVPRSIVVGVMVLGTLFIYSTGDYRSRAADKPLLEAINSINFQENLKRVWNEGGLELENAVYQIESADRYSEYDFGAFHWNTLIFNYVPAQIFGREFKESLLINTSDRTAEELGHSFATGTTLTGVADSFRSFWYLGALQFLVFAYVLARIYKAAMGGNMVMQLLYMLMLVNGLHAITHHTNWFVSPWVHLAIFLMPALLYAKSRKKKPRQRGGIDMHQTRMAG